MKNQNPITREQWLNECKDLIIDEIFAPVTKMRKSLKIKVSVGYAPNTKAGSKVIGVCLSSACSEQKYNEIFISPTINDSNQVLATLVHEMIHAIDDCKNGHQGPFVKIMNAVGLEGKPTATVAGAKLNKHLSEFVEMLGVIPHAKINLKHQKRQVGRNIKVYCKTCGFKFNTSRTQIQHVLDMAEGKVICPACSRTMQSDDF